MNTHLGQNFRRPKWGISRLNGLTERRRCMSMVQELLDALMIGVFIKRMERVIMKNLMLRENSSLQILPGLSLGKNKSEWRLGK